MTNPWKSILAAGTLSLAATVSRAVPAASDRGTTEPPSLASAHAPGVGAEIQAQDDDTAARTRRDNRLLHRVRGAADRLDHDVGVEVFGERRYVGLEGRL